MNRKSKPAAPAKERGKSLTASASAHAIERGVTASAHIQSALRREIMVLDRKPGEAIVERDIAAQYNVSRTPVREAILRLSDEGLIQIFPQSGTFVSLIPLNAFHETIIIRKALEDTTTRLAAERAKLNQISNLHAIVDWMREMEAKGEREQFHEADEAFHSAIAESAGHPGIWNLVQQTKMQIDRYRRLTLPQTGRMARVIKDHAAIATAIAARSPSRATEAMAKHLDTLLVGLGNIQDLNPEYFAGSVTAMETNPAPQKSAMAKSAKPAMSKVSAAASKKIGKSSSR